jgi:RNA polymerase sigma factor (sigma-70 family)
VINIPGIPDPSEKLRHFREDYERYHPVVVKHLYYLTGTNNFNEDIAHEVFLKYWDAGPGTIEYPGAWLCKVAGNLALNTIRSQKRREAREGTVMETTQALLSVDETYVRSEEIRQARLALRELSEEQRTCLLMKFSGYSYEEIHQATGIPKGNIGQLIARGKGKFTELYRKAGGMDVLR